MTNSTWFHLYEISKIDKFIERKNGGYQGLGERGVDSHMYTVSVMEAG